MIAAILSSKLAATAAAAVVAAGAAGTAAYAGVLPAPLQNAAHEAIGAPAATVDPTPSASEDPGDNPTVDASPTPSQSASPSQGPDATGPASVGLCTAYQHGGLNPASTAYQALATAAGGADGIADYCAKIPHPGKTPNPVDTHTTGKPTAHQTGNGATNGKSGHAGASATANGHSSTHAGGNSQR
jgi:hypothetical protein